MRESERIATDLSDRLHHLSAEFVAEALAFLLVLSDGVQEFGFCRVKKAWLHLNFRSLIACRMRSSTSSQLDAVVSPRSYASIRRSISALKLGLSSLRTPGGQMLCKS